MILSLPGGRPRPALGLRAALREQLKLGAEALGHRFEVTEVAGDRGAVAPPELRRDLTHPSGSGKVSLYGYYEYGQVWSQDGSRRQSATITGAAMAVSKVALTGSAELPQR